MAGYNLLIYDIGAGGGWLLLSHQLIKLIKTIYY